MAFIPSSITVFNITELLEAILLNLDNGSLLRSQSVNKTFQSTIAESPTIQEKLYFKQSSKSPISLNPLCFRQAIHLGGSWWIRLYDGWFSPFEKPPTCALYVTHNLMSEDGPTDVEDVGRGIDGSKFKRPPGMYGSWKDMHITSAAGQMVFKVRLNLDERERRAIEITGKSTVGDLVEVVLREVRARKEEPVVMESDFEAD